MNNSENTSDRHALFDRWAEDYDRSVDDIAAADRYPFAGYDRVMDTVCARAGLERGARVLDLGTGTGNLAQRLLDAGCRVVGTDFSAAMLEEARAKLPAATFVQADLRADWPTSLDGPFEATVSAYVLHEFDLQTKLTIAQDACRRLTPGGRFLVGDIAFATRDQHDQAQQRWADGWDHAEHYWIADETVDAARAAGLLAHWTQISHCAGVLEFAMSSP